MVSLQGPLRESDYDRFGFFILVMCYIFIFTSKYISNYFRMPVINICVWMYNTHSSIFDCLLDNFPSSTFSPCYSVELLNLLLESAYDIDQDIKTQFQNFSWKFTYIKFTAVLCFMNFWRTWVKENKAELRNERNIEYLESRIQPFLNTATSIDFSVI